MVSGCASDPTGRRFVRQTWWKLQVDRLRLGGVNYGNIVTSLQPAQKAHQPPIRVLALRHISLVSIQNEVPSLNIVAVLLGEFDPAPRDIDGLL